MTGRRSPNHRPGGNSYKISLAIVGLTRRDSVAQSRIHQPQQVSQAPGRAGPGGVRGRGHGGAPAHSALRWLRGLLCLGVITKCHRDTPSGPPGSSRPGKGPGEGGTVGSLGGEAPGRGLGLQATSWDCTDPPVCPHPAVLNAGGGRGAHPPNVLEALSDIRMEMGRMVCPSSGDRRLTLPSEMMLPCLQALASLSNCGCAIVRPSFFPPVGSGVISHLEFGN